jgi:hypothetical protein
MYLDHTHNNLLYFILEMAGFESDSFVPHAGAMTTSPCRQGNPSFYIGIYETAPLVCYKVARRIAGITIFISSSYLTTPGTPSST